MRPEEFIGGALLHCLLQIRRAAFAPEIGVRYTEGIRSDIAAECFRLEDACRAYLKEEAVAEGDVYIVSIGMVQQFKKDGNWQPVVRTNDVNGQAVSSFTIKTITQKLISVSLWPEFAHLVPHIAKGALVGVEGKLREETKNGVTYYNLSASSISVCAPVQRVEREVVNAQPVAQPAAVAPEAQPAAAAPAQPAAGAGTIF